MTEEVQGTVEARVMEVDYSDIKNRYISIPVPNYMHKVITTLVQTFNKKNGTDMSMDRFVRDTLIRGIEEFALPMMGIVLSDPELTEVEGKITDAKEAATKSFSDADKK